MTTPLEPQLALIVHGSPGGLSEMGRFPCVLSLHAIRHDADQRASLDAGRLLTEAEAAEIGSALLLADGRASQRGEFIPATLLRETPTSLTWFRPPQRSTQYWRTKDGRTTINAVLPGLVFHVESRVLFVAAYAGGERPHRGTELFHAPLGNVYADGRICTGNATLPETVDHASMAAWERVLLGTNYAHINHTHTLRDGATTEQLVAFWTRRQRYATPPAAKLLRPLAPTLSDWLTSLTEDDS
ncbi:MULTISPECIES: PRTRC system protein B [Pseudomonadota]|uniref:PRTRC system protein B n=1 Tax=Rhodanobacter denitrificans TaxID=666685 RepID=M4NG49_9GAMM|nr:MULTISPECIES: PRTRC system protein B [Pseudomonadota]AGG89047.1 PRTRC system protein B [Rhodanobacter denitrificans]TAN24960.1 MAG: PRTRC system protein B [Castellaniella sp.]UJJ53075.1 PRTRC system protein B [Rhodanobacter denitrificans]